MPIHDGRNGYQESWSSGGFLNIWLLTGAKEASLKVNGSVLENKTGQNTENGWTIHWCNGYRHYQRLFLQAAVSPYELRLHPVNAVMQTMSYDIAGNLVAEAGADNAIVKKEYDGLNRLVAIRTNKVISWRQ